MVEEERDEGLAYVGHGDLADLLDDELAWFDFLVFEVEQELLFFGEGEGKAVGHEEEQIHKGAVIRFPVEDVSPERKKV